MDDLGETCMKKLQTGLLALVLASVPAIFSAPAQAGDEFNQGVKLMGEKRYAEATKLLKKAVYDEPNNAKAQYYLALSWHYQGRTSDALVNYQAVLKKFPGTDEANRSLQAIQGMSIPPGTTDAQWYGKPAPKPVVPTVRTYGGSSSAAARSSPSSTVRSYSSSPVRSSSSSPVRSTSSTAVRSNSHSEISGTSSSSLPEQATIYFEQGDARLKVDVFINNRPIKMVFDTGATGVVVGKNQLEEIGIKPPDGEATGQSGGSATAGLQPYWMMPADVKVGTILRQNFPIKVLSYNSAAPLLGQSFIHDFEYSIDKNAGIIRLKRKGSGGVSASASSGYSIPFEWEGPKMLINVEVNGRPYPMYFDTGNSASAISLGMHDVKALNLNTEDGDGVTTSGVTGTGGGIRFKIKRIKLGPIERFDVPVIANYASLGKPLVGQDLYEGYEYIVDNDRRLIRFIRR